MARRSGRYRTVLLSPGWFHLKRKALDPRAAAVDSRAISCARLHEFPHLQEIRQVSLFAGYQTDMEVISKRLILM
jgi:hypothetical protein